jgi:maltooligosyltrehalose trehalohydrolase
LVKRGSLYQGQRYEWQGKLRGTPSGREAAARFIFYLQNHDQTANTVTGRRLPYLSDPARYRALTAVWLLAPQTPLFFMGQESGERRPFLYFAHHRGALARAVLEGRRKFLAQFPSFATAAAQTRIHDPSEPATFRRCKLAGDGDPAAFALHRDLLALRREDPVISAQDRFSLDGAVLTPEAFILRWSGKAGDRLLVVNLGRSRLFAPAPEPLLAPPSGRAWRRRWSSNHPRYGGRGDPSPFETNGQWRLQAASAVLLTTEGAS